LGVVRPPIRILNNSDRREDFGIFDRTFSDRKTIFRQSKMQGAYTARPCLCLCKVLTAQTCSHAARWHGTSAVEEVDGVSTRRWIVERYVSATRRRQTQQQTDR